MKFNTTQEDRAWERLRVSVVVDFGDVCASGARELDGFRRLTKRGLARFARIAGRPAYVLVGASLAKAVR